MLMSFVEDSVLHLVESQDVLASLRSWLRRERQRAHLTQGELAAKSNVPATTISRFERTGLGSTDSLMRILFAMNLLDPLQEFLKERMRLAAFPETLSEPQDEKPVLRVRHRRSERS